jgi:hypothetical protein
MSQSNAWMMLRFNKISTLLKVVGSIRITLTMTLIWCFNLAFHLFPKKHCLFAFFPFLIDQIRKVLIFITSMYQAKQSIIFKTFSRAAKIKILLIVT